MEPMLVEECKYGAIPRSITNLLEFFESNNLSPTKNDIIVGLIYILMLESGFIEKTCTDVIQDCDFNYRRLLECSKTLPLSLRGNNIYNINFVLKSNSPIVCSLTLMFVSDDLLVNCTIKDVGFFSFLLDPLMYIITSTILPQGFFFQNLDHLSRSFKDQIAFPAKIAVMEASGEIPVCLQNLPYEILHTILSYLKITDVIIFAQTCRTLCQISQDSSLWVKLLDRDYRKKKIVKTYEELKFLYELKYAKKLSQIMVKGSEH